MNFYSQQAGGGIVISNIPGGNPAADLVSTYSSSPTPYSVSGFPGSPVLYSNVPPGASGTLNLTATDPSSPASCCAKTVGYPSASWGQNVVEKQSEVVGNQTMNVAASVWQPAPATDNFVDHATSDAKLTYSIEVVGSGTTPVAVEMQSLLYTTPDALNAANEVVGSAVASVQLPTALDGSMQPFAGLSSSNGLYVDYDSVIYLDPGVAYPVLRLRHPARLREKRLAQCSPRDERTAKSEQGKVLNR